MVKYRKKTYRKYKRGLPRHFRRSKYATRKHNRFIRALDRFSAKLNQVAEKKNFTFNMPNIETVPNMYNNSAVTTLSGIFDYIQDNLAAGVGRNNRVGMKIHIRKIVIKAEFVNNGTANAFKGNVGLWIAREKDPNVINGQKSRGDLITTYPYSTIPDLGVIDYKWLYKKTKPLCQYSSAAISNTNPSMPFLAMRAPFKYKINLNKNMEFASGIANNWKLSDGKGDIIPIPWVDVVNDGGLSGTGPTLHGTVMVTFTDV